MKEMSRILEVNILLSGVESTSMKKDEEKF